MLNFDPIVTIELNRSAPSTSDEAYETGLILGRSATIPIAERFRVYTSAEQVSRDGFANLSKEYKAAQKYFASKPAPKQLIIGRINTDETPVKALNAILTRTDAFYGIYICEATDAEILAMAAELQNHRRFCLFYSVTGALTDALASTALFSKLYNGKYHRTLGLLAMDALDAVYVMATAMGLSRDHAEDSFSLCYKPIPGMETREQTQDEIDSVKAKNGNVYITRGLNHTMLENGCTADGTRFDELLYMDHLTDDLQNACLEVISGRNLRLPQNDTSTAVFFNALSHTLDGYVRRGILGPALWRGSAFGSINPGDMLESGYALYAASYDTQTESDRLAHKAMPIYIALCFTGSVESVVLSISAQ